MLSFNMEDVLFSLVFQYLLSGSFLLPELRYPHFAPGPVGSISDSNFVWKINYIMYHLFMTRDVMILMRADALRGQVGGGWALEIETFLSPVMATSKASANFGLQMALA
jgi:hypothetical protein